VLIGRFGPGRDEIQTIALFGYGRPLTNFTYPLAGTPCRDVISRRVVCTYSGGVQEAFPDDQILAEMGVQAYAGTPLVDSLGRVLGIMVALHSTPFDDVGRTTAMLRLFAVRASLELDRMLLERQVLDRAAGRL
jgi:hypothetical protein